MSWCYRCVLSSDISGLEKCMWISLIGSELEAWMQFREVVRY